MLLPQINSSVVQDALNTRYVYNINIPATKVKITHDYSSHNLKQFKTGQYGDELVKVSLTLLLEEAID